MTDEIRLACDRDRYGWYAFDIEIGGRRHQTGGSTACWDPLGDFLRGGLMLVAGAWQTDIYFHCEPGISRLRLRKEYVVGPGAWDAPDHQFRCLFEEREIDDRTMKEGPVVFDAAGPTPFTVARAIHAMAAPHLVGQSSEDPAFVALGLALDAVGRGRIV